MLRKLIIFLVFALMMSCSTALAEEQNYREIEISIAGDPSYPLGATLCLPGGSDRVPVVLLVQGSGVSDRDETIGENRPFRDIAHALAERGIASLRYDKRAYIYPESAGESGMDVDLREELLDDVNAALEWLRQDERINPKGIFVLGHSLGGMMVPAIAVENPDLAGAISMAGSLRPLWEIIYDQNQEVIKALQDAELPQEQQTLLEDQIEGLEADMQVLRGDFSNLQDDALLLGIPVRYWKSIKEYCGLNLIDQVHLPLLILQGSADFQVYPGVDFPLWEEKLSGRDNVRFELYEGVNHLMMPTQGRRDVSEYLVESHVEERVIEDIAEFILENAK